MSDATAGRAEAVAADPPAARAAGADGSLGRLLTRAGDGVFSLYALHLWALFGIALSNLFLGLGVVASAASWRRMVQSWGRHASLALPLAGYVLVLLVSTALSRDPLRSLAETGELLSLAAIPLGLLAIDSERRARLLVNGLIVVSAGVALYGLGQFLVGYGVAHRIRGPFSIYMTFAGYLMLADLLLVAQMLYGGAWKSAWRWLALAAINLALLGSLTRSAWVGLAVTLALLLLVRAPRYMPLFLGGVALLVLLAPGALGERIQSIADLSNPTNYDRLCMVDAGLHMVAERPLFGIGPGMAEELYPLYRHRTALSPVVPHLHNNLVHLAAERGLLSVAAYLWLTVAALVAAWRGWRRRQAAGGRVDLYVGALAGLVAFNLAGVFEYNWGDTEVLRVALFLIVLPFALRGLPESDGAGRDAATGSG